MVETSKLPPGEGEPEPLHAAPAKKRRESSETRQRGVSEDRRRKRFRGQRWWRALGGTLGVLSVVALWVARPMFFAPSGADFTRGVPAEPVEVRASGPRASVLFLGDTHFGESYAKDLASSVVAKRGYDAPLDALRPLLDSAGFVVANLETPLTQGTPSSLRHLKKYTHFGVAGPSAQALRRAGISAVSLANNHANDAFWGGLQQTSVALNAVNITAFGAGGRLRDAARPLRLEVPLSRGAHSSGGLRIAVVGTFERQWDDFFYGAYATSTGAGVYPLARRTLAGQLKALKAKDPELYVIVYPHWGKNYRWRTHAQRQLAHALLRSGADAVIGHGAHVFQEAEFFEGRLILYSLGNFVFLSPGRYQISDIHPWSIAARLDFLEREGRVETSVAVYFIASDNRRTKYRPHLLDGVEFERAANVFFEGGVLDEAARQMLRNKARLAHDDVGRHVRIDLGAVEPRRE